VHPTHNYAFLGPPEFKSQTASRSVQPFFAQLHGRVSLHFTMGRVSLQNSPCHGDLDPYLIRDSLDPSEPTTQTASRLVQQFLHSSPQNVPILYNGRPLPPTKLPLFILQSRPPSNTWFLGLTRVLFPNGISIGSAVFCRTHYCDRPTDRPTGR